MKLFPKLASLVSAMMILAIGAVTLSFYWSDRSQIKDQLRQVQESILQNLVHIAQESFVANDDLLLVRYTSLLPKWNHALVSAEVSKEDGRIIAHTEPGRIGQIFSDMESNTSLVLVMRQQIMYGSRPIGIAQVTFSQQKLQEELDNQLFLLRKRFTVISIMALLGALCGSFLLARSWVRPIRNLSLAAERIGQGKWELGLTQMEARKDELGDLSATFVQTASQLKELDQMKEDFVASVTHELRSPLGAIESYINQIAYEMQESGQSMTVPDMTEFLTRMRMNTQRLTKFVNDLLDVAALERGKMTIQQESVDLLDLAEQVVSMFDAKARERQLTLQLSKVKGLSRAWVDREKIQQVLINLVSNAMKFTPEQGKISVSVTDDPASDKLILSIKDTGIGISDADQSRIFNKFEQSRTARVRVNGPKGTGLGLAIARQLVELNGGEIGFSSEIGKGSTFYIRLPRDRKILQNKELGEEVRV